MEPTIELLEIKIFGAAVANQYPTKMDTEVSDVVQLGIQLKKIRWHGIVNYLPPEAATSSTKLMIGTFFSSDFC